MYAGSDSINVDLEKEYSPSHHAIEFKKDPESADRVVENFQNVLATETKRVSEKYQVKKDISYGGHDDNQLLDIFFKDQEHGTPIFAYIHGGYWQMLDKSTSGAFVEPFVERNYRVINVDYNLCPIVTLSELCSQMWNFFKWLYKYAHETEAKSITICGHSAGAHLTTIMLQKDALKLLNDYPIKTSLVLIGGVYDLRELWKLNCSNENNNLSLTAQTAEELSPICWKIDPDLINFYRKHDIKIHVIVGEHESKTFIGNSQVLAKKLSELGLNAVLKTFKEYDHLNIIEEASNADASITKYLFEVLGA